MMIELPQELELALKAQANARGMSVAGYVREVVERNLARNLAPPLTVNASATPFKTGRGVTLQLRCGAFRRGNRHQS
jgi:hypothetical protein